MTTPLPDAPVRSLFARVEPFAGPQPDLAAIARLLADFAGDTDYLRRFIDRLGDRSGTTSIHVPERGPRLMMAHRRDGEMGAVHSHRVWVALAPVTGCETHRRYTVAEQSGDRARLDLAEERHLGPCESVTLLPPDDIHAHGHVRGFGEAAYILILTGDNQLAYEREQFDLRTGRLRRLPPGDRGDWMAE